MKKKNRMSLTDFAEYKFTGDIRIIKGGLPAGTCIDDVDGDGLEWTCCGYQGGQTCCGSMNGDWVCGNE